MDSIDFKAYEKIQIKNLLQQDNLFWILEHKMLQPLAELIDYPSKRVLGVTGIVRCRIAPRHYSARNWYYIETENGDMIAHVTELKSLDKMWVEQQVQGGAAAIESWLKN